MEKSSEKKPTLAILSLNPMSTLSPCIISDKLEEAGFEWVLKEDEKVGQIIKTNREEIDQLTGGCLSFFFVSEAGKKVKEVIPEDLLKATFEDGVYTNEFTEKDKIQRTYDEMLALEASGYDWSATPEYLQTLAEHGPRQPQEMGEDDLVEEE